MESATGLVGRNAELYDSILSMLERPDDLLVYKVAAVTLASYESDRAREQLIRILRRDGRSPLHRFLILQALVDGFGHP